MEERKAFDILIDYPKKHNLEYVTHRKHKRNLLVPNDPITNKKFVIFQSDDFFFLASDSFGMRVSSGSTYTGLYGAINLPKNIELKMFKRFWIDRILRSNIRRTGHSFIDKHVTITSNNKTLVNQLINDRAIKHFNAISNRDFPFNLVIAFDYVPLISPLKNKMIIGIETKDWLYQDNDLEALLTHGKQLLSSIIKNV